MRHRVGDRAAAGLQRSDAGRPGTVRAMQLPPPLLACVSNSHVTGMQRLSLPLPQPKIWPLLVAYCVFRQLKVSHSAICSTGLGAGQRRVRV